jgi:hypothetical protein
MVGLLGWIVIAVAVVIVGLLVAWYATWILRTKRRTGSAGIVQRIRLTCPKCGGTFDYDFVPGAAVTAIRLGSSRYMSCPICHKWSTFDMRAPTENAPAR